VRKAVLIAAFASALTLVASSIGVAGVSTPVLISGPSTSTCTAAQIASQPGRNYRNAEVEPQVALFQNHAIAMWHQDRWSGGGGNGIGVGVSSDGGATWAASAMPWSKCEAGTPAPLTNYFRNSDPWVSFGPDGTAYASALAFNILVPNWANSVVVATSTNFGAKWDNVGEIPGSAFTQFAQSTDKNSTTADPATPGTAYTVWDTLIEPTDNPDDNPHTASYTGPAYFSKTVDGGKTWSQAQIIISTKQRQQTIGNIVVVDTSTTPHTLFDFANLIVSPNTPKQGTRSNQQLAFVKSTDGGATWTQPQIIGAFNSLGVHDPNTGAALRTGDGLEEVAIDPSSGQLYVVWQSSTNYGKNVQQSSGAWDDEILAITSKDHGQTWTAPSVVHHLASGLPTYTPTVAVNNGKVAVTYYDNRNLAAGQTDRLPTDYWVSYSSDGVNFGDEQHIAGSFDSMTAPVARGFFLGDYEGLQPSGSGFKAVFVKTNCDAPYPSTNPLCAAASSNTAPTSNTNPTDVFIATLS
jgi:hypothetical protein